MWAAMAPSVPGSNNDPNNHHHHHYTTTSSSSESNGSQHVYVHHMNERPPSQRFAHYPPPPPPPPQPVFMPVPYPQPQPMPMYMGGGMMGGGYPQPQQPPVIVVNNGNNGESDKADESGKTDDSNKDDDDDDDDNGKGPKSFSSILLVSIIFVVIGSLLGFICVGKVYDVFEHSMDSSNSDHVVSDYLIVNRQVALGMGAFATLCYCIAFMLAFYAGMKYKVKQTTKEKKQCCRDGLLITAWVVFCLTSINNLIILILAFDEEARIYPEVALCAVFGSIAAWLFVFGWAEMTRRSR